MNKVILIGRLVRDPEVRYSQGQNSMAVARYSLAVQRKFKREGDPECDFISCVVFGKNGEFAEKYLQKGVKIAVEGHIQTGSYTNKDGVKVYTTDVIIDSQEFAESKNANQQNSNVQAGPSPYGNMPTDSDGFMHIPAGIDEKLPFN